MMTWYRSLHPEEKVGLWCWVAFVLFVMVGIVLS